MQVIVAEHAGFCWGVRRAIEIATTIREKEGNTIYVLGHLVHNEEVVHKLEKMGMEIVENFTEAKEGSVLLITAHGLDYKIIQRAKRAGFRVIDTTCPIVQKVHRLTRRFLDEGRKIIIIGHSNHIEVKGINGVTDGQAQIVGSIEEIENIRLKPQDKVGIVAQTTFNVIQMHKIVDALHRRFPNVDFLLKDSICYDVKDKQREIRELATFVDAIVVVGSKASSNTTRLYELALQMCPKTYLVSKAEELCPIDFSGVGKVCVTAGASTPDWIIREVVEYLGNA
ncbi:TPA: 4-hydroxy-3-methylbut-2-enyl diphosphate reductase [Candidatus Poribacteria bacterium]|nr:4-hydroxy-3-methylbut-2-enyl diphosphate reductase [Candidatus Poribacteria bacterium]